MNQAKGLQHAVGVQFLITRGSCVHRVASRATSACGGKDSGFKSTEVQLPGTFNGNYRAPPHPQWGRSIHVSPQLTPYITPSMEFPSNKGVVRGCRGQQLEFASATRHIKATAGSRRVQRTDYIHKYNRTSRTTCHGIVHRLGQALRTRLRFSSSPLCVCT